MNNAPNLGWTKDEVVGFVDESGSMGDGEPHVVAGLFFPSRHKERAQKIAEKLMKMTPPIPDRKGREKWPKAIALPREGFEIYVRDLCEIGCVWVRMTKTHLHEGEEALRSEARQVAQAFRKAAALLDGTNRLLLSPGATISAFEEEADRHPIYSFLVYRFLVDAARAFKQLKLVPLMNLCFDEKFQRKNEDVLQFLVRYVFYTELKEAGEFQVADIFGLNGPSAYRAYIGKDPDEPCLFLADIYAHASGMVAKGQDTDGCYSYFLSALTERCRSIRT